MPRIKYGTGGKILEIKKEGGPWVQKNASSGDNPEESDDIKVSVKCMSCGKKLLVDYSDLEKSPDGILCEECKGEANHEDSE